MEKSDNQEKLKNFRIVLDSNYYSTSQFLQKIESWLRHPIVYNLEFPQAEQESSHPAYPKIELLPSRRSPVLEKLLRWQ